MQHEKTLPVTAFGAAPGVVRQGGASPAVGGRRTPHGGRHPLRWRERPVQTVAGAGGARRQTRPNGTAENRVGTAPSVRMLFSDRFGPGS